MITLPYSFDTTKYVRLGAYAMLFFPFISIGVELRDWLMAEALHIPELISLAVRSAMGIAVFVLIVHFMLKYLNVARGTLSRAYISIEPLRIFKLGNALPAGNYALSDFKSLKLVRAGSKRQINIGSTRVTYWLKLVWANESRWPVTVMISSQPDARDIAKELAKALNLPLEEK